MLLERVPFIWKPLKFKWKATIRNIFRYKKNMILTIISVMGCTALILVGFGLNDSVTAASQYQYQNVILYESAIEYTGAWEEGGHARYLPRRVGRVPFRLCGREHDARYPAGERERDRNGHPVSCRGRCGI